MLSGCKRPRRPLCAHSTVSLVLAGTSRGPGQRQPWKGGLWRQSGDRCAPPLLAQGAHLAGPLLGVAWGRGSGLGSAGRRCCLLPGWVRAGWTAWAASRGKSLSVPGRAAAHRCGSACPHRRSPAAEQRLSLTWLSLATVSGVPQVALPGVTVGAEPLLLPGWGLPAAGPLLCRWDRSATSSGAGCPWGAVAARRGGGSQAAPASRRHQWHWESCAVSLSRQLGGRP